MFKIFLFLPFLLFTFSQRPIPPTIVFMSDFGTVDDSVAICKGVMLSVEPSVRILDLTHQVTPFSIADGARFLAGASLHYPAGTIFVAVVDPGVAGLRRSIVARSRRGHLYVLPDNGLLTFVEERDGLEVVREVVNRDWMIGKGLDSTFQGRDLFAVTAGRLARGDDWSGVGPLVEQIVKLPHRRASLNAFGIEGEVVAVDGPYGNLFTNISEEMFTRLGYHYGDLVNVRLGRRSLKMRFVKTFGDVSIGQPLLYIDSRDTLALAINQGNFSRRYRVSPPAKIRILSSPTAKSGATD